MGVVDAVAGVDVRSAISGFVFGIDRHGALVPVERALIVATLRARVTLVEKDRMGGDCLNTGCVPSKSLIRSAKLAADMRRGHDLGFAAMQPDVDFNAVMKKLYALKFKGDIVIEREISGPQQARDIKASVSYLRRIASRLAKR